MFPTGDCFLSPPLPDLWRNAGCGGGELLGSRGSAPQGHGSTRVLHPPTPPQHACKRVAFPPHTRVVTCRSPMIPAPVTTWSRWPKGWGRCGVTRVQACAHACRSVWGHVLSFLASPHTPLRVCCVSTRAFSCAVACYHMSSCMLSRVGLRVTTSGHTLGFLMCPCVFLHVAHMFSCVLALPVASNHVCHRMSPPMSQTCFGF